MEIDSVNGKKIRNSKQDESDSNEEWGDGNNSDSDSSDSDGGEGFNSGSEDDNHIEDDSNLALARIESKSMNKDYPYTIIPFNKIKLVIASKLLDIASDFDYANLNDYIIWKIARDHKFVTKDAKNYI